MHRFINTDILEFRQTNQSPINGYESLPIMTLEKVLEKIIPLVPDVEDFAVKAKQYCNRKTTLLTWDESAAIYLYSMPTIFFTKLNEAIRAENRTNLEPWFPFLKLFMTALEKLPSIKVSVWRGLLHAAESDFDDNKVEILWSLNSCSRAGSVVEIYLERQGGLLNIETANGKDISAYSMFAQANEIVLMPGMKVRMHQKPWKINSICVFDLKEEIASEQDMDR